MPDADVAVAAPAPAAPPGQRPAGTHRGPGVRWRTELDELSRRRPRLVRLLRGALHRPEAVLGPVAAVMAGTVAAGVPSGDAAWFQRAGAGMWGPVGLDVFAEPGLQIGPLYLALVGAMAAVLPDLLGSELARGLIGALQAVGLVLLCGLVARRAARFHGAHELPVVWAAGLVLVMGGFVASAAVNGHFEEIAVGLLIALAALAVTGRRHAAAGLLVGGAFALKQWAVLGVPVLLVGRRWRGALLAGTVALAVVVAAYGPFVLLGDFRTLEFAWGFRDDSVLAVLERSLGLTEWASRAVQAAAAVLVGAAVAWWAQRSPLAPLVAVVAVRLLLDPLRLSYYSGPLVVVLVVWAWSSRSPTAARLRWVVAVGAPVVVLGQATIGYPAVRHVGTAALVATLVVTALLLRGDRRQQPVTS